MYHITNDYRHFRTQQTAERALLIDALSNMNSKRLMGRNVDIPNWHVFDQDGNIVISAEELFERNYG